MSRCRRKDYKCVFCALIAMLPRRPHVQAVVSDFEAAVWSAAREVLPGVELCSAVVRSTSRRLFGETSKQSVYSARIRPTSASAVYVCRQTMALPYLPADVIADEFQTLHTASDDAQVAQHLQYMERQWISSTTWPPITWSVFRQPVRTNNDVEGWHCRLNDR